MMATPLPAGAVPLVMVFDEKGNGGIGMLVPFPGGPDKEVFEIPSTLDPNQPPSTPGLQYHPEQDNFTAQPGDVVLVDPGGATSDLIRFNGDGSINFYSVPDGRFMDGLADNSAFPTFLLPNVVFVPETYPGPDLGAKYVPTPGQPGFSDFLGAGVPYYFISEKPWPAGSIPEDAALLAPFLVDSPEPSTSALLSSGLIVILIGVKRRITRRS